MQIAHSYDMKQPVLHFTHFAMYVTFSAVSWSRKAARFPVLINGLDGPINITQPPLLVFL